MRTSEKLPVEIVFHPNWWYKNYGIRFNRDFFYDPGTRVESDRLMRQYLYDRFPDLGVGEQNADPRPVVGGVHLAAGYIISGMLGCEIRYFDDRPPEVIPAELTDEQIEKMEAPNILETPIMRDLFGLMEKLEKKYGYLEGDINWEGVQNVALNLRGHQLFIDYYMNPELCRKLFDIVERTIIQFLEFMISKTGTTSVSVNRIVGKFDPKLHLHSNCTLTMISPETYGEHLARYDELFSSKFQPYGIHYCGNNMHNMLQEFAKLKNVIFYDVGWGSDIKQCREALPDAFLSLRLSPERIKFKPADVVEKDIEGLLQFAKPFDKAGLCCINMDFGTPDENVQRIFRVAERYR